MGRDSESLKLLGDVLLFFFRIPMVRIQMGYFTYL